MPTKIEWCEETWNPVTGCNKVDEGCRNCYAERMAKRLAGRFGYPADDPFRVTLYPGRLDIPQHWKKPRKIFVNSMSDLFHPAVPNEFVKRVYYAMACAPQHQYMILTKRPDRMLRFISCTYQHTEWPQVWLGASVHDQKSADERIPILLQTPAAKRFISYEPALGALNLCRNGYGPNWLEGWDVEPVHVCGGDEKRCQKVCPEAQQYQTNRLDLIICGGESGPGARPMHVAWARSARDQCQAAGVSFVFKQWGNWRIAAHGENIEAFKNGRPTGFWLKGDWHNNLISPKHGLPMIRVTKKRAGRTLDGATHDG